MKAIDGNIYFTAYKFRNEKDFTDPVHDNYLYKYDLRWNKSTCLYENNADSEGEDSSALEIAEGDSKDIYILYSWCTDNSNPETDMYVDLFKLEDDQMQLLDSWENVYRIRILDNEEYGIASVNGQGEDADTIIYEFKDGKIGETELMRKKDGYADIMHEYISVVCTSNPNPTLIFILHKNLIISHLPNTPANAVLCRLALLPQESPYRANLQSLM